jgi:outer membrane protein OmpA-like peptidoglycan-associated protein
VKIKPKPMRIITLVLLINVIINAQLKNSGENPFGGAFVITAMGGITTGNTDFETHSPGFSGGGMLEYFLPSSSGHLFGLRGHFTGNTIIGKENISLPGFRTNLYSIGTGISYMYSIDNLFFPYAFAGISLINFSPTVNGSQAPNLRSTAYSTSSFSYSFDIGTRIAILKNVSFNLLFSYNLPQTDNIDDITYSTNNDKYTAVYAGISLTLFSGSGDSDNDGIPDTKDLCPDEPEDIDGFEDNDGCPEPDNDKDGIADKIDKCPNFAEDMDGFEDNDGCPEPDNDKDGIFDSADQCPNLPEDVDGFRDSDGCPDIDNDMDGIPDQNDKCPNTPEDIDGFEDSDGCPDFDNDKDGITDKKDKCPDTPETFNGYEDDDGCPDVLPEIKTGSITPEKQEKAINKPKVNPPAISVKKTQLPTGTVPDKIILEGVLTFEDDRAKIKKYAYNELDKIAETMKQNPGLRWRIEGYTDKTPGSNTVSNLGEKRANEVMLYLVKKGVPLNQIEVIDMGDKYPRSDNNKPSGRSLNRRIEIKKIK